MMGDSAQLDAVFGALAAPPRREMLARLRGREASAGELWEGLGITKPAVTKHLSVLEHAGVIERRKIGRSHLFGLRAEPLAPASEWLLSYRVFWEARLDALADHLEEDGRR
jgi:DNA-binding transcriptional ArsR family regulator